MFWHVLGYMFSMKKQIIFIAVMIATCIGYNANAQVSVNINIGNQPVWGPVGYDYVDYYYIPDMDAYYSVPRQEYTYMDNGRWITTRALPPRYSNYDLYHGYKVVVNEPTPWLHNDRYRTQYVQYKNRHDQPFIRDSRDTRYFANPNHPQHAQWEATNHPQQVAPNHGVRPGSVKQHNNHNNGVQHGNAPQGGHDNGNHNGRH